jgi:branched-subunit amino acid ABC-type transport system permease component
MSDYLPFIVFGIATGAIYGLSAMGLVLTYKTSGLFNFGHGALSALAAFVFYTLHQTVGMPWPLAVLISVFGFGLVGGVIFERFAAVLANVSTTFRIVGTVGLLVGLRALIALIYGGESRTFSPFLSQNTAFNVASVDVTYETVIIVALGAFSALALFLLFRTTRVGIAMRAVVDDASLLDMSGLPPARIRLLAWVIGVTFAAVSGVLFAEVQAQIQVDVLSLLVVQAFGAAALARFGSLPLSFVGGLGIGIAQKLVSKQASTTHWLSGLDLNVPFLVLLAVLVFTKRGKLKEIGRNVKARTLGPSRYSPQQQALGYAIALAMVALLPQVVGTRLPLWNTAVAQVTLFLSLSLLVRLSGQISLCQFGFAAIGAASFGQLLTLHLPWGVAIVLASVITGLVGALIAIPAIRLSGLYLGLATLGFGIMLNQYFYPKSWMFGIGQQLKTPRPAGFGSDTRYFYLCLAIAIAAAAIVLLVERSRLGKLLRALADAPLALSTLGADIRITLVLVFTLSASLAGVGGALYAGLFGQVGGYSFPAIQSLPILAVLFVAGRRLIIPAFLAPVLLFVLPGYLDNDNLALLLQVAFGTVAFIVAGLSSTDLTAVWSRWTDPDRLTGPARRAFNSLASRDPHTTQRLLLEPSHDLARP